VGQLTGSVPDQTELEHLADRVNDGDLSMFDQNAVVTELAAQTAMLHQDRCTKNRFYFHDGAGHWAVVPYDLKDAFGACSSGLRPSCC
jgi:hypothetical protein